MTRWVPGSTVVHIPARIEWAGLDERDFAVTECGRDGEPEEMDPEKADVCSNCKAERAAYGGMSFEDGNE